MPDTAKMLSGSLPMKSSAMESSASPKAKPGTSAKPYLLTPSEIDSLRQGMHSASEWMRQELRGRRIAGEQKSEKNP
uniref:Uncharacterized protein n=1 Tax=mine drainage metagenome TaxID=410659 RepID=E6QNT7_9ZZZZ